MALVTLTKMRGGPRLDGTPALPMGSVLFGVHNASSHVQETQKSQISVQTFSILKTSTSNILNSVRAQ